VRLIAISAVVVAMLLAPLRAFGKPSAEAPVGTTNAPVAASAACPANLVPFPQELRQKLLLNVCGASRVVPNRPYRYEVVLANNGERTYRRVDFMVIHYEPITHASPRGRPGYYAYPEMRSSVWRIRNFGPRETFRVRFALSFKKHRDPKGSNFAIDVRASAPATRAGLTYDVWWRTG